MFSFVAVAAQRGFAPGRRTLSILFSKHDFIDSE